MMHNHRTVGEQDAWRTSRPNSMPLRYVLMARLLVNSHKKETLTPLNNSLAMP